MSRAVRFDQYGDVDVLRIEDVEPPTPAADQILVEVVAAGINPGEISIRAGLLHDRFPATFPSGEGSDFAGRVRAMGSSVTEFAVGDEVLGWSDWRSSHADYVVVPADHLTRKPLALDWIRAGGLFVAGVTAYAAVRAVQPAAGETVVVSGAAGGVGSLAVQLARNLGAYVVGIASEANATWLRSVGVTPVAYGDDLAASLPAEIDAFIDTYGNGYVDLAVGLGIDPARINTIIDYPAAAKAGAKTEGSAAGSDAEILAFLADEIAWGRIVLPIAAVYPLDAIKDAYTELAARHTRGKIVLSTELPPNAGRQPA
ncbi:NADPH:quinone reductase-like Zn-dependent oxidoreductase [Actinoplanes tereljensis]|uniref:NADPH:quinone reductase n=1 Tax=Paractinoplanes tereljensis TaxID=571912 RepID=A0A919NFW7_9ACTN|nr:NADP-dependent oxidoreductase [Actinoplanes tereljensis]GIF17443.1 NADPH:quinone reductase [Actinoplanes tereljensis]